MLIDGISDPNTPLIQGWPLQLLTTFFFFIGVGLFEELMFRAIINDALIYQFRNVKHIFLISAIVTSSVFGFVHVFESAITGEINDLATIVQAALKTLSAGIFGLNLLVMYWKTRNIWACAVVHGGYDFLTAYSQAIIQSDTTTGTYVNASHATGSIIAYLVQTVIELIIFIVIWKKIGKTIDFEKIRKEW